ncbi:DUF2269 family protein [Agromyces sp. Marseille-P2726]|uniref:DUF2269 family protein n=1 Tax=Agromyces sp. Marseille-P2726 TaxID=2709132 RepID=UPI00156F19EE|nr:hypothetical protein [Agromyces sp. Marseille-P2726]
MYLLMIFLHVLGVVVFALGHGTSVAVAFRVRREREHARIAAMLDVSSWSTGLMYAGLLLTIIPGVVLGFMGGFWGEWWLWLSIGLLVLVMGAMYAIATPAFTRLRFATGATMPESSRRKAAGLSTDGAVEAMATSWRPTALAIVGGIGLAVILWLMIAQPA